eukprot:2937005-Amphidinium_carterae.2
MNRNDWRAAGSVNGFKIRSYGGTSGGGSRFVLKCCSVYESHYLVEVRISTLDTGVVCARQTGELLGLSHGSGRTGGPDLADCQPRGGEPKQSYVQQDLRVHCLPHPLCACCHTKGACKKANPINGLSAWSFRYGLLNSPRSLSTSRFAFTFRAKTIPEINVHESKKKQCQHVELNSKSPITLEKDPA